jgi:hypothetical protein
MLETGKLYTIKSTLYFFNSLSKNVGSLTGREAIFANANFLALGKVKLKSIFPIYKILYLGEIRYVFCSENFLNHIEILDA